MSSTRSKPTGKPADEPVFTTFRRRAFRPFYYRREVVAGGVVVIILASVAFWVAWRGAHPEPGLFEVDHALLGQTGQKPEIYERPVEPWVEPGSAPAQPTAGSPAALTGIFPAEVADSGWSVPAPASEYDTSNVYEKINGREGYYRALGFQRLHTLTLTSRSDSSLTIDIELFDMGEIQNALGALAGEISSPEDTQLEPMPSGFFYATRNAGYLSQGKFYARMVGSDDAQPLRDKILALRDVLTGALPAEPLPWGYAVFAGKLSINPASVQFVLEDVFAFDFASQCYVARTGVGDMEAFARHCASEDEATALAAKFAEGFAGFGRTVEPPAMGAKSSPGLTFSLNEYMNAYDAVGSTGRYVYGVRLAPDQASAAEWATRLREALAE